MFCTRSSTSLSRVTSNNQYPMAQVQTIALAGGTGDLGRYLHEELVEDRRFAVALLTREVCTSYLYHSLSQSINSDTQLISTDLRQDTHVDASEYYNPSNRLQRIIYCLDSEFHRRNSPHLPHPLPKQRLRASPQEPHPRMSRVRYLQAFHPFRVGR